MATFPTSAWAEIIAKAAVSPLGIAALLVLIVGFVVVRLINPDDKPHFRLIAVVMLMIFCGALMGASIYSVQPTALPPGVAAGSQTEGVSQEPPGASPQSSASEPTPAAKPSMTPAQVATVARTDCGTAWSGWVNGGGAVGNPCPAGCVRGAELGRSYRAVDFPPRPQTKHKFQCWRE